MRTFLLFCYSALALCLTTSSASDLPAPFLDAFWFYQTKLRREGTGGVGLIYDKYFIAGGNSDISIGSTGFGFVSVCLGDTLGLLTRQDAVNMTVDALDSLLGARKAEGFDPERSANGFFAHFLDAETGKAIKGSEISTIDTALMAAGVLFARNYLNDPTVEEKANALVRGIAWGDAIVDPRGNKIYMVMERNGTGDPDPRTWTSPFNEYFLVARVGYVVEQEMKRPGNASQYFTNIYGNPPQSFEHDGAAKLTYGNFGPVWSDRPGHFGSSFIVQFCYYLSSFFQSHCSDFMNQAAGSDWLYFRNVFKNSTGPPLTNSSKYQWGCGAGAYPNVGYYAASIDNNIEEVYSVPIIAGFFPADNFLRTQASTFVPIEETVEYMYQNEVCTYQVDGRKLLWRRSLVDDEWRAPIIESVDFSTFLLGYGWKLAGKEFFADNAI